MSIPTFSSWSSSVLKEADNFQYAEHGDPHTRGRMSSYLETGRKPHCYRISSGRQVKVDASRMTPSEIASFHAGYEKNERLANKKRFSDSFDPRWSRG